MEKHKYTSIFPVISTKQWKQKIQFLLDGKDYNQTCIKQKAEIIINPFYNIETSQIPHFISARKPQLIYPTSSQIAVECLKEIENNIDCERFLIENIKNEEELLLLLPLLPVEKHYFIKIPFISQENISKLKKSNVFFCFDYIEKLSHTGNFFKNKNNDEDLWKNIWNYQQLISIDISFLAEAGATEIQQIAYCLAILNEYINLCGQISTPFKIVVWQSSHPNFYLEIAKIRALRWCIESFYSDKNIDLEIISRPSKRYMSFFKEDFLQNKTKMQWSLQACMLGGSDGIIPYNDLIIKEEKDIQEWIKFAKEKLDICKEQWINGGYYQANITYQIAQKSLILAKDIITNKGYLAQLKTHIIQRKIKEKAQISQKEFQEKTIFKLGELQENRKYFLQKNRQKTLIEPILSKRIYEFYEQKAFKDEK